MKLAYFSPFNPIKSGISDFSEELILCMSNKFEFDITLFIDGYKMENKYLSDKFMIYDMTRYDDENVRNQFDVSVFHVGNNYKAHIRIVQYFIKYGGILELHDIALHHFLAEATIDRGDTKSYLDAMRYCHGNKGAEKAQLFLDGKIEPLWEKESLSYPVNKYLIDRAEGIIVHSDFAMQMIKGIRQNAKVINIPHHTAEILEDPAKEKAAAKKNLNIPNNRTVFGTFGFASENKRLISILQALSIYNKKINKNFLLFIVGQIPNNLCLEELLEKYNLQNNVIVTGYISLYEFKEYMKACDLCFNLRYPTQGESSGALHRMLGYGKIVAVTDIGTFQEYPDRYVKKIGFGSEEVPQLVEILKMFTSYKKKLHDYEKDISNFAKDNFSLPKNVKKYYAFFDEIINNKYKDKPLDILINKLIELTLVDNEYLRKLSKRIQYIDSE